MTKSSTTLQLLLVGLAMAMTMASSGAQTLFKCTVNGKVSYGERPCESGTETQLAVPPAPRPDPELAQRLARQKALLTTLEKERGAADEEAARAAAEKKQRTGPGASAHKKQRCNKMRLEQKWIEEDLRKAAGPATEPLRQKLKRHTEAMALECQG